MKNRILLLGVATFGIPLIFLVAEIISWILQAKPFISLITDLMPDLFYLIHLLWLAAVIYTSTKLIWFLTQRIQNSILKFSSRGVGVFALTMSAFFIGVSFMGAFTSALTVRAVPAEETASLTHHSSGTLNSAP